MAQNVMKVVDLPDDVLESVFRRCGSKDIFALCKSCRRFRGVLDSYANSIIPHVASSEISAEKFPDLFARVGKEYSVQWLCNLIPKYLATVLLGSPSFRSLRNLGFISIPDEDPLGNDLRYRLENGWRIIRRLSRCSQRIYAFPEPVIKLDIRAGFQNSREDQPKAVTKQQVIQRREEIALRWRRTYIQRKMSQRDACDYVLVIRALSKAMRYHPRYLPEGNFKLVANVINDASTFSRDFPECDWPGNLPHEYLWYADWRNDALCPLAPWILWFVLHTGPDPFWRQWTSHFGGTDMDVGLVADLAWEHWEGQEYKTILCRITNAMEIDNMIRGMTLKKAGDLGVDEVPKLEGTFQHSDADDSALMTDAALTHHIAEWREKGGRNNSAEVEVEDEHEDREVEENEYDYQEDHEDERDKGNKDEGQDDANSHALAEANGEHEGRHAKRRRRPKGQHPMEKVPFFVYLGRTGDSEGVAKRKRKMTFDFLSCDLPEEVRQQLKDMGEDSMEAMRMLAEIHDWGGPE